MKIPEVHYLRGATGDIAYQVFGEGPDLHLARPFPLNLDLEWENPAIERFYRRLASFSRVMLIDLPPGGLSGVHFEDNEFTAEVWASRAVSVMDDLGTQRTAIVGFDLAGTFAALLAGSYPDRVAELVLMDPAARFRRAPDYRWGMPEETWESFKEFLATNWGTGELLRAASGGRITDDELISWYARLERSSHSPSTQRRMFETEAFDVDLRQILSAIKCNSLIVVHPEHSYIVQEHGRFIADRMPNATLVERPGPYAAWWYDDVDATLDLLERFITGAVATTSSVNRVLSTVLFNDIVGSTELAADLGDDRWREILDVQASVFERHLKRFNGRLVKTTGDGLLATFDGPARAIRCGCAIRDDLRSIGIEVRTGIHTGEIELLGDDIGGLSVHIGARVMSAARPGEVATSSVVKGLVAGSGIVFEARGSHELKGVPGEWEIFSVVSS